MGDKIPPFKCAFTVTDPLMKNVPGPKSLDYKLSYNSFPLD